MDDAIAPKLERPPMFQISPGISVGQILTSAVIVVVGAVSYMSRVDATTTNVAELKLEMTRQLSANQRSNDEQFLRIRQDIANFPDVRAELMQLGKRVDASEQRAVTDRASTDNRAAAQSARLEQIQQMAIQNRSDLDNILRTADRRPK